VTNNITQRHRRGFKFYSYALRPLQTGDGNENQKTADISGAGR